MQIKKNGTQSLQKTDLKKDRIKECVEKFLSRGVMSSRTCQWPMDEPGKSKFTFCKKPIVNKRPYCEKHCDIAYRKKSTERDKISNIKILGVKEEGNQTQDDDE